MNAAKSIGLAFSALFLAWGCGGDTANPATTPDGVGALPTAGGGLLPTGGTAAQPPTTGGTPGVGLPTAGRGVTVPPTGAGGSGPVAPVAGTGGPTVTPGMPVIDSGGANQWTSFGGNLEHTRSSGETIITAANAAMMGDLQDIKAPGVSSTPAVYKGVVYWGDWEGAFYAHQLPTGGSTELKMLWKLDRSANDGGYSGSPSVTETMVIVANRNGLLTAVDRMTGAMIWETKLDAGPHTYIWSSPVAIEKDDMIVVGIGGAGTRDNSLPLPQSQLDSFHGSAQGVQLSTGKLMWNFAPSPAPQGSGCSVWSSAAVDTDLKLAFIGVGNNYSRPTSDKEDSLLALNYMTGELKWWHQFTANDAFTAGNITGGIDGDVGATPNLYKIGEKAVVGVGDKPAGYHVFERATGTMVWENLSLTSDSGFQGGILQPATYSAEDNMIFVASNNSTSSSTLFAFDASTGAEKWTAALSDPTFGGSALGKGVLFTNDSGGNVRAFDTKTGENLWETRLPAGSGSGISIVNGMLFVGYGYHFSASAQEPLMGGLRVMAVGGKPPVDTGPGTDCVTGTTVTADPTFTNVYQGILCANGCDKVCHADNSAMAGLSLQGKANAYKNLVGAPSAAECAGMNRVTGGMPTASVLYQKLANTQMCGTRMPPGGPASGDFPAATLQALSAWIMAGAPNN